MTSKKIVPTKRYVQSMFIVRFFLLLATNEYKIVSSLSISNTRGKCLMAIKDTPLQKRTMKRYRLKSKISSSISAFSPSLLFVDDSYSQLPSSVNYVRQDISSDLIPERKQNGQRKRNKIIFSKMNVEPDDTFSSLVVSDTDLYQTAEDDSTLSYLPSKGIGLPPKTANVLTRMTRLYMEDVEPDDQVIFDLSREVMEVIDDEYRFNLAPFVIDEKKYNDETACKVLAFAVLHKIPFEIISYLWGNFNNMEDNDDLSKTLEILNKISSYESLEFTTKKLPIRLRSKHTPKLISLTRANANKSLEEATIVIPPQKPPTPEEFLKSIEQLSSTVPQSSLFKSFALRKRLEDLQFFPVQNKWVKRWTSFVQTQTKNLKSAGRAGLIAYGMLNAAWYSFAMVFSWKRITVAPYPGVLETPLQMAFWKFTRVLTYVYLGSQLTKLPRIILAAIMAPFGGKILSKVERKLNVGSNEAFWIAAGLMIGTCFSIWSGVIFFDAFLTSGGSFLM